jgi:hypothetical protein
MSGLWEIGNKIDEAGYKLSSLKDVVEIIAEKVCSDPESGAIWAVAEMIEAQEEKLYRLSEEVMKLYREMQEKPVVKKEKKK